MASIISMKLNLVPGGSPGGILPRVRVSQGDAEDRIIQFELFDGLAPADMSDVDQCYIGGMKPDGNGFTVSCTITSNVATAILTDQATVLAGEIRCKLYLLSATGSVRSASFTLDVDPDPLADAGTSDTDITAIVQAAAMYANNASESAQEAAQAATGAATAGATAGAAAGQAAAEAVVNGKLDKSTAAEAWAPEEEYEAGQYRLYTNGHLYKCILNHTSSSSITPEDTTYWEDTTIADEITSCNSNYANVITTNKIVVMEKTNVVLQAQTYSDVNFTADSEVLGAISYVLNGIAKATIVYAGCTNANNYRLRIYNPDSLNSTASSIQVRLLIK